MRLLIIGGSGLIGWNLVQRARMSGHEVIYTYHSHNPEKHTTSSGVAVQLDIRNLNQTINVARHYQPDAIIHAAAMTDVDQCEKARKQAREVNVDGTQNVISAIKETDAHLLFFSTSFVFDGKKEKFRIKDKRNAINHYGDTKIEAENEIIQSPINACICRIDQPYCWPMPWHDRPFVSWVLDRCGQGEQIPVFTDWYNNPVYVPDCTRATLKLLETDKTGIYHIVGPDYINRYQWAQQIADKFGYNTELIQKSHSSDADLPAKRPNNRLHNDYVKQTVDVSFRTIQKGLEQMKKKSDAHT